MNRNIGGHFLMKTITLKRWLAPAILLIALFSIALAACSPAPAAVAEAPAVQSVPAEITVDEAYDKYQQGAFFLDVRTQAEWDDFHAPNSTHIPLDQLASRLDEVPQGEEIVVVCRSGNRSQAGRDILRDNGFDLATSMAGGLTTWGSAGYPLE
jgi:rhodanese-related sulfurtransferase